MSYVGELVTFLKKPVSGEEQALHWKPLQVPGIILLHYLIYVGCLFIILIIWGSIKYTFKDLPEGSSFDATLSTVILVVLIAPVVEELIFRLPLRFNKVNLLLSATLLSVWMLRGDYKAVLIVASVVVAVVGFLLFYPKLGVSRYLEKFWEKHYGIVFYFFSALFALMHILNYTNIVFPQGLFVLWMVMPQFALGVMAGYLRVRYDKGLFFGMAVHAINNLVAVVPVLLLNWDEFLESLSILK